MLRALVFDFDGLILDTERPVYEAWRQVYADHGVELDLERWQSIIGTADHFDPMDELEDALGRALERDALHDARRAQRDALLAAEAVLPGVVELLAEAQADGLGIAVASSSPASWVEEHLERLGLIDHFAHLACFGPGLPAKPAPDLYLAAVAALGVDPGDAVALEDSAHGVTAAKAAGLWCVAVPHDLTRDLDLSGADWIVGSLRDVSVDGLRARFGNC